MREVKPVGILSILESQSRYSLRAEEMSTLVDQLDRDLRKIASAYLRKGSVVLAIMEYTTDILGSKFGTSGGSGLLTDGEYYWRGDAADYVEHYGIALDEDFLWRVLEQDGDPPVLTQEEIIEVDRYFMALRHSAKSGTST
ncbi:hypothetical protein ACFVIM_09320 [Streptomyces sp. NPDC057638]|uniref:hypothetical protein n=1 Tax=Streptomyces sp. NPDC057638 TaxID=3346190 RepID=UPI00369A6690